MADTILDKRSFWGDFWRARVLKNRGMAYINKFKDSGDHSYLDKAKLDLEKSVLLNVEISESHLWLAMIYGHFHQCDRGVYHLVKSLEYLSDHDSVKEIRQAHEELVELVRYDEDELIETAEHFLSF